MNGDKNRGTLVLTGATGGIGSAFAHEASKCADLILVDQNQKKLVELQKSLFSRNNSNHKAIVCDLSVEKDRDRLISEISSEYDMIDGLINNAAYTGDTLLSGWIEDFENQISEYQQILEKRLNRYRAILDKTALDWEVKFNQLLLDSVRDPKISFVASEAFILTGNSRLTRQMIA